MQQKVKNLDKFLGEKRELKDMDIQIYSGDDAVALSYVFISFIRKSNPAILPNSVCEGGLRDIDFKEWGNGECLKLYTHF